MAKQREPDLSRPEAIRRLLDKALGASGRRRVSGT